MRIRIRTKLGHVINQFTSHVLDHNVPLHLLEEAIQNTPYQEWDEIVTYTRDFDYTIGFSRCVAVTDADDVSLVRRGKRKWYSCVVRGRNPEPTSLLTVVFNPSKGILLTAYMGPAAPREPFDPTLTDEEREVSLEFWSHHALIL